MKKNIVQIRPGTPEDMTKVYELVKQLALYEKATHEVITDVPQYLEDFKNHWFDFIVAIDNGQICGMALYNRAYSTWKGAMIYLEDLIVEEAYRGRGIGNALLANLYQIAKEQGAVLVKWQVLDWNEPAIAFYKKEGVELDAEWINCKKYLY